jgi:hypothetical protein
MANVSPRSASRPHGRRCRLAGIGNFFTGLTIALFSCLLVFTQRAEALELRCRDANVTVHSSDPADAKSVCDGAADAVGFLAARGLETNGTVEVVIVDRLPEPISPPAFGGYLRSERRAYLLTFSKIAERGTVFNLPLDRTLYRSLAIHEVAHAIAALNFRIENPSIEAEEFIAYTTMFTTLPKTYRDPVLKRFVDDNFANEFQINSLAYLLNPVRFGVLAYKYFMKPENGADFLQQILAGQALREFAY